MGWPALTEGEWRVVALAAQGHTNAEIADRLFLSRYTAETHLKHVFTRLGLRSRAEPAAIAASARTRPPTYASPFSGRPQVRRGSESGARPRSAPG